LAPQRSGLGLVGSSDLQARTKKKRALSPLYSRGQVPQAHNSRVGWKNTLLDTSGGEASLAKPGSEGPERRHPLSSRERWRSELSLSCGSIFRGEFRDWGESYGFGVRLARYVGRRRSAGDILPVEENRHQDVIQACLLWGQNFLD